MEARLGGDFTDFKSQISNFRPRISNFKVQILSLRTQLLSFKAEVLSVKTVLLNFKAQVPSFKAQILNCKFQITNSELPAIRSNTRGFTLLELMVVLTLLLILATMAMPIYQLAIVHAREAVLKDDLYTLRKLIDEFTLDKQHPPASLDDLVEAGYLRGGIPVDPFTGSNETWRTDTEDVPLNPSQAASGIVDVHSGSDEIGLDGTAYSSW